jgi:hypothetical protein
VEWCGGFKASVIMNDEFDFDFEAVKHNERDDDYNFEPSMKMAMTTMVATH